MTYSETKLCEITGERLFLVVANDGFRFWMCAETFLRIFDGDVVN